MPTYFIKIIWTLLWLISNDTNQDLKLFFNLLAKSRRKKKVFNQNFDLEGNFFGWRASLSNL